jgi:hypothetical protein
MTVLGFFSRGGAEVAEDFGKAKDKKKDKGVGPCRRATAAVVPRVLRASGAPG